MRSPGEPSGRMVELDQPRSEGELAVIRSIFDDAGIPLFVHNEHFGSLLAGPQIALYNGKRLMVAERDLAEAREILRELRAAPATPEAPPAARPYSVREKLRMVAEFLIFGWFLPGRRERHRPTLRLVKGADSDST